jgi:hypothetical protein
MYGGGTFKTECTAPNMSGICQIDTGLNVSSFKSNSFTVLPPSLGTATYTSVTGSVIKCDYVALPSIQLANKVNLGALEPVVCSDGVNGGKNNLLGLDAFTNLSFTLSAKKSQLTLLEKAPVLPHHFESGSDGHILLPIQSGFKDQIDILAMFDTGAAISTVDIELVKAQPSNFTIIQTNSLGTDAFGNPINSYLVIGSIQVNGLNIVAQYFIAMDFAPFQEVAGGKIQMILGYNTIEDFDWTINMKDKTWEITQ